MKTYEIKHRYTDRVLYSGEGETLAAVVVKAASEKTDLGGADLGGADLGGADLGGANLGGADLGGADLRGADLRGAYLRGADLGGADLRGAYLRGAYLRGADLGGADLEPIKLDIYDVFSAAPADVPRFLDVLRAGKIDGSVYNDGAECVCLVGTFEKLQGCGKDGVVVRDSYRPAERFFLAIRPGNTPSNHWAAKLVEEWTEEWLASNPIPVVAQ